MAKARMTTQSREGAVMSAQARMALAIQIGVTGAPKRASEIAASIAAMNSSA